MRVAHVLLAGVLLAGCVSSDPVYNPVIPFEAQGVTGFRVHNDGLPESASAFDTPIDYSSIQNPAMYNPAIGAGAAAAGGAIAVLLIAAVDASIDDARNKKINEFLKAQKFDAKKVFYDALSAELSSSGYAVELTEASAGAPAAPALTLDVDLLYYGYTIISAEWTPAALATVKVMSADGKQTLLNDSLRLGSPPTYIPGAMLGYGPGGSTIVLPYDPAHLIANEDAITQGDPKASIASLRFALESVARGAADLVRGAAPPPAPPAAAPAAVAAVDAPAVADAPAAAQ
jgi:hypothetical protein